MKTPPAPPYLLPSDDAVVVEPWRTEDGSEIGDRLEHWDPYTDIVLVQVVTVDIDGVRTACQLGPDSALAVTASWVSSRTRLGAEGRTVELGTLGGRVRAFVEVRVPGVISGGRLDLRTRLVLRHSGSDPSPISPTRPGAILWTQGSRIDLEGSAARFPVTPADFTLSPRLPDNGAWALEWNPEALGDPVLGSMRLLVNSCEESLIAAIRSGSPDPRATLLRSFITYDVARSLVYGALRNAALVEQPDRFEDGSVGRMLVELLASCWPGIPVVVLAARGRDDPARLEAELQAYLEVAP